MKLAKIALFAVVGVILVAAVVLWIGVDATALGNEALAQLGVESGMSASIREARFSLGRGLSLRGLAASAGSESGVMEGSIESLDLQVSWLPLFSGEVEISSIVLESPELRLALTEEALSGESSGTDLGMPLEVQTLRVRDGIISVTMPGESEPIVELRGLTLNLDDVRLDPNIVPPLLGATGTGALEIDSATVGGMQIDSAGGTASLANGLMEMTEITAAAPAGTMRIPSLVIDLAKNPAEFEVEMHADSVNLNLLSGYPDTQTLGDAALTAKLAGATGGELTGSGLLRLAQGGLPTSASLSALDGALGTNLSAARYEDTEITFVPIPGGIRVEPFELRGDAVRVRGDGTLLNGQDVDFRVSVGVPRATASTASFAGVMLDGLTDTEGWVNFPVIVSGTALEPNYAVDKDAVRRLAEDRARQSAEDEASRQIGRAIGRICCSP